jgi:hypothetical protein
MTRLEFAGSMALLEAATRPMSEAQAVAYFELLGDLPADFLMVACKRALLESQYPTIPPVGTLRRIAVSVMQGHVAEVTADQVWQVVMKSIAKCDVDVEGSVQREFRGCPPIVWKAVETFGFMALYNLPDSAIETARAQFRKIYEGLAANEQALKLLPSSVKESIAAIGQQRARELPAPENVKRIAAKVGQVPF